MDDDLSKQFAAMGADDVPAARPQTDHSDEIEIMPANWNSLRAWLACETQWRVVATMGGMIWLGLDYAAVDVVLRRSQSPEDVFGDLRVMEAAALDVFAEAQ